MDSKSCYETKICVGKEEPRNYEARGRTVQGTEKYLPPPPPREQEKKMTVKANFEKRGATAEVDTVISPAVRCVSREPKGPGRIKNTMVILIHYGG